MRWTALLMAFVVAACDGDGGTEAELPFDSFVLARADGMVVPAEIVRTFTVTSIQSGRILKGSLVFATRDSADLTLHTDFRHLNESGQEVVSEESCFTSRIAYRFDGTRIFLDLERAAIVFPPSTGQPPQPGVSLHDTLVVSGMNLTGAHDIRLSQNSAPRRVEVQYFAAPVTPNQCSLPD